MFDSAASARRERLAGGLLAATLEVGLALLVIYGLAAPAVRSGVQAALVSLDLGVPPPPARPRPLRPRPSAPAAP
ncbi:MAG: hypothetical protein KGK11_02695, partial [Sphingomonadales bacterium]|nr:hypothetical protein [Sphingomonadales bacterium]